MADYTATAASNTFVVNDAAAFADALSQLSIRIERARLSPTPNNVYLVADTDHGEWPSEYLDGTTEETGEVDLPALIAGHLADGQVAILKEAGAEKASYVGGIALAVNAAGETEKVDLDEIYVRAARLGPHLANDV
jgi:hypothetical protein